MTGDRFLRRQGLQRTCPTAKARRARLLAKFALVQTSDVMKMRMLQGTRLDPANLQVLIDAAARYKFIPDRFDARDLIYAGALR